MGEIFFFMREHAGIAGRIIAVQIRGDNSPWNTTKIQWWVGGTSKTQAKEVKKPTAPELAFRLFRTSRVKIEYKINIRPYKSYEIFSWETSCFSRIPRRKIACPWCLSPSINSYGSFITGRKKRGAWGGKEPCNGHACPKNFRIFILKSIFLNVLDRISEGQAPCTSL